MALQWLSLWGQRDRRGYFLWFIRSVSLTTICIWLERKEKKKGQVDYLTVEMQYGGVKLSRTVYLQERVQDGD